MERRLAAILSADVVSYSRLMADDEAATVRTVTEYRDAVGDLIRRHRGRVVDASGDNVLAEFASVVDAVEGAVAIQRELALRNARLPEPRRMRFRIGVNLGDVIADGERVYGDGVNIAARVQTLADPGGVAVSGSAYEQVCNKLGFTFAPLGDRTVKNIAEPVRIYRVVLEPEAGGPAARRARVPHFWSGRRRAAGIAVVAILLAGAAGVAVWAPPWWTLIETASRERMAFPLPDRPSIAVLPFANMSGDAGQEYFSDGITEDLITSLSKLSGLFVIARNSVFTYKGRPVKVQSVAEDLGVRYVLEGSVRKAGARVRITAQLVDATTGHHLWADRYDRDLADVFAVQDEVTQKIVAALAVTLTDAERGRLGPSAPGSVEAYEYALQARALARRGTQQANLEARRLYERALELAPAYAAAHVGVGYTYFAEWTMVWTDDPGVLDRALGLAREGLALDDTLPACRALLAEVYLWKKQHDLAVAQAERVLALDPNNADGYAELAEILAWTGDPAQAIAHVKTAMRLNPRPPLHYFWVLGHASYLTRDHDKAIEALRRVLADNPDWLPAHVYLAATYAELGRLDEAREGMRRVGQLSPRASLARARARLPYRDDAVLERVLQAVARAEAGAS